jgi:hypothetical protein
MTSSTKGGDDLNATASSHVFQESDAVISPGLSVHFYGKTVGLYSSRLKVGKGVTEMPVTDLIAIIKFFQSTPAIAKLLVLNKSISGDS